MNSSKKLTVRYFYSILIDYFIFIFLGVLTYQYFTNNYLLRGYVVYLYLLFVLSEDKFLGNHSIGKLILGIRIYPINKHKLLTWTSIVLRRVFELISPFYFIIYKRPFDINNKSESCIDFSKGRINATNKDLSQQKIDEINLQAKKRNRINSLRLKSFLIDFLFISWAYVILIAATLSFPSSVFQQISEINRSFLVLGASGLMVVYAIFKDFVYGVQSVGKRIVGLEIINNDGSTPTKITILLRNLFWVFYTIEVLVLLVNGKRIGELVSKTTVRIKHVKVIE